MSFCGNENWTKRNKSCFTDFGKYYNKYGICLFLVFNSRICEAYSINCNKVIKVAIRLFYLFIIFIVLHKREYKLQKCTTKQIIDTDYPYLAFNPP